MMSWMALPDLLDALDFIIGHDQMRGPIDFVSQTGHEPGIYQRVGKESRSPALFPVPAFILKLLLEREPRLFLSAAMLNHRFVKRRFSFLLPQSKKIFVYYSLNW